MSLPNFLEPLFSQVVKLVKQYMWNILLAVEQLAQRQADGALLQSKARRSLSNSVGWMGLHAAPYALNLG